MDLDEVANTKGVGLGKLKALEQLQQRAKAMLDEESTLDEAPTLLDELIASGIDPELPWASVFTKLNKRARTVFDREGLVTLRDIAVRYEAGTLIKLPGLGQGSIRNIADLFESLVTLGLERFLFGEQGRPQTIDEVIDHFLEALDDEELTIIQLRFMEEATLEQIAQQFGLSREAIRLRLDKIIDYGRAHYSDLLTRHFKHPLERLRSQGGILHLQEAMTLSQEHQRARQLLAWTLEGTQAQVLYDTFLSVLSTEQHQNILSQLKQFIIDDGRDYIPMTAIIAAAATAGLRLPEAQLAELLQLAWNVSYRDGALLNPWLDIPTQYGALLKSLNRPVHLDELSKLIQSRYEQDPAPTERQIYLNLQRNPQVFYVDRGTYAHRDALPQPIEQLELAALWAINKLKGIEHAVSASVFLPELLERGLLTAPISPLLLRDLMGRHESIKTFQSTDFVAHLDSFQGHRKTQEEHINEILLNAPHPLTCDEVCALYPDYLTYHRSAIYTTLTVASGVLNLPQGRFIHRDNIGLTHTTLKNLLSATLALLEQQGKPMTATSVIEALCPEPAAAYLQAHPYGSAILWALCRERESFACGRGELMMARHDDQNIQDPLIRAILNALEQDALMTPTTLRRAVVKQLNYMSSHGPIYDALEKAEEQGFVQRVLGKYRALEDATNEHLFAYILDQQLELPSNLEQLSTPDLLFLFELYQWSGQDQLAAEVDALIHALSL